MRKPLWETVLKSQGWTEQKRAAHSRRLACLLRTYGPSVHIGDGFHGTRSHHLQNGAHNNPKADEAREHESTLMEVVTLGFFFCALTATATQRPTPHTCAAIALHDSDSYRVQFRILCGNFQEPHHLSFWFRSSRVSMQTTAHHN